MNSNRVTLADYDKLELKVMDLAVRIEMHNFDTCPAVLVGIYDALCSQLWAIRQKAY